MRFMLMIYDNPDTRELFTGPEGKDLMAEVDAVMAQLTESGELVGGEALADPSNTRTVRVQEGVPVVTDGPLAEAKEHFGGYLMVECETIERAVEIAAAWPSTRSARWRSGRSWTPAGRRCEPTRGPAARARAAGPRRARAAVRRTSTPARTPSRRRCSRQRGSGPARASPSTRAAG